MSSTHVDRYGWKKGIAAGQKYGRRDRCRRKISRYEVIGCMYDRYMYALKMGWYKPIR